MKKITITVVLLLFCVLPILSQTKNITVRGSVVEADTQSPVFQATVQLLSLPDSTYIGGIATAENGTFALPKVAEGNYLLQVTYIGFQPTHLALQLKSNNPNVNVGTLKLKTDAILLSEAIVVAEAPPVTVDGDTIAYSASAYRTPEGAMLEELIKKLPGAVVSDDGTITINGKEISKILVDGKEFFSDDPKVAMKNLPVNMVEKVKSYDKKSDMARITGIDDGEEEAVLDLTVKKGMKEGWIGNLIAGAGNKSRYEAQGMMSRFQDDSSLSFIGSLNNTNNTGTSEFGDSGQGRGNNRAGTGVTTSKSLGLNLAKDTKNFQIGGNIQYGYTDNEAQTKSSTERFLGEEGSSFGNSLIESERKRHDVRGDFRMEWRPDSMTTVVFRPSASYSHTKSTSGSWSETLNNDHNLVNDKQSTSLSKSDNVSLNGRLEAYRKLNNKGRNVSIRANLGYSDGGTDSESSSLTEFFEQDSIVDMTRTTDRNNDSRSWSIGGTYTEPVFANHFLQGRYEFSHSKRLSESLVADQDSVDIMPNGYVESLSSRVENTYDTHTIELSLRGIHSNMMYSAGLSLMPQTSQSKTTIGPNASSQLPKQNVFNFAPQVMFRYQWTKQHVLMLHYRGRSSEPSIENLQQVIDQTDPLNIQYGNPNLKPSFTHNVRLNYNRFFSETMRSFRLNLNYSNTQNSVANKMTYDPKTGGTVSKKVNVNGNWQGRGFFSFDTPLKNQKYTLSSFSNANYSDAVSYTTVDASGDVEKESELSTTHNLGLSERFTANYRASMFDVSLNAGIAYSLARNSKQTNSNRETFDYSFGGSTNITLPWDLSLSTDISHKIKDGYGEGFKKNETIWNAQLSKTLLNNKATLRIKIYDILKEQTNLSRSVSETMISDTQTNTLGSYFMVHFVYRINTLGKSAGNRGRGGRGMGPGFPGGGPGGPPPGGRF